MGLSHLTDTSETVSTPGGVFTVRGLTLEDITAIVRQHTAAANALFVRLQTGELGVSLDDNVALFTAMAQQAPELAAQVIAIGADEPDPNLARKLPFPVQIDALEKIARQTFASEGGAGKVLETIIRVVRATAGAIKALQQRA